MKKSLMAVFLPPGVLRCLWEYFRHRLPQLRRYRTVSITLLPPANPKRRHRAPLNTGPAARRLGRIMRLRAFATHTCTKASAPAFAW